MSGHKNRVIAIMAIVLALAITSNAQVVEWVRWYQFGSDASGNSVVQAEDGGFFVIGTTNQRGLIVRTNAPGDSLWARLYGDGVNVRMNSVVLYQDELWIAGSIDSGSVYSYRPTLFRLQLDGELIETIELDRNIFGQSLDRIELRPEGGFLVSSSIVQLAAVDISGNTIWSYSSGTIYFWVGSAFAVRSDGGYIVALADTSSDGLQHTLIKVFWLNANGQAEDSTINISQYLMGPSSVAVLSDDIVIVGGFMQTGPGFLQMSDLLFCADRHTGIVWQYVGQVPFGVFSLEFVNDEIWSVIGSLHSEAGPRYVYTKFFNTSGQMRDSVAVDVAPGGTNYNIVQGAIQVPPHSIVITGATDYPGPEISYRAFLAKVTNPNSLPEQPAHTHQAEGRLQAYMGDGFCRLSLNVPLSAPSSEIVVYDILGRLVHSDLLTNLNSTAFSIPMPFASGPYFIRLTNGRDSWATKVMIQQ